METERLPAKAARRGVWVQLDQPAGPVIARLASHGWAVSDGATYALTDNPPPALRVTSSTLTPDQAEAFADALIDSCAGRFTKPQARAWPTPSDSPSRTRTRTRAQARAPSRRPAQGPAMSTPTHIHQGPAGDRRPDKHDPSTMREEFWAAPASLTWACPTTPTKPGPPASSTAGTAASCPSPSPATTRTASGSTAYGPSR